METKSFPTEKVISAIADTLICDVGGVYEVLSWMTGVPLFTHQLPRAGRAAAAAMLKHDPRFAVICEESNQVTPDNYAEWTARWLERYGPEMEVIKLSPEQYPPEPPVDELKRLLGRRRRG